MKLARSSTSVPFVYVRPPTRRPGDRRPPSLFVARFRAPWAEHGGPRPEDESALLPTPAQPTAGRRVLVVDDELSMRLLCTVNLRLAGYEVTEAEDGTRALQLAEETDFDLILLDVMLPDIGGHDVARRLEERRRPGERATPIAFISARATRADLRAGYDAGGIDYITKPFDPLALAARVDAIIASVERGESDAIRRARLAELQE